MTHRLAALMLLVSAALLAPACTIEESVYGNDLGRTCVAGSDCDCTVTGNCYINCPDGGCTMRCLGDGNCFPTCDGGGCDFECAAGMIGNCLPSCSGGGCTVTCENTGSCVCSSGCTPQ